MCTCSSALGMPAMNVEVPFVMILSSASRSACEGGLQSRSLCCRESAYCATKVIMLTVEGAHGTSDAVQPLVCHYRGPRRVVVARHLCDRHPGPAGSIQRVRERAEGGRDQGNRDLEQRHPGNVQESAPG